MADLNGRRTYVKQTLQRAWTIGLLVLVACSGSSHDRASRDAAFQELFGFPPSGDVTRIESSWRKVPGHYIRWVRADCGVATRATIRSHGKAWPERFVILTIRPGMRHPNVDVPSWWNEVDLSGELERFVLPGSSSARLDTVYVWVDSVAGTVYASRNVAD